MNWISVCLVLGAFQAVLPQYIPYSQCEGGSCYTGDLLIGREDRLSTTSTCGMEKRARYCIVSHLQDQKKCFYCDSRQPYTKGSYENSHRIQNVVTSFMKENKKMWWQSENGMEDVSIRFDLEAIFHFTHLIMTFKTFRPRALTIERSADFGETWRVYRHFAYDCGEEFPGVSTGPLRHLDDIICDDSYSAVEPSTGGEVIFRVLPPHIPISDPYSDGVQDMINITNLRINFTRLHTLGDNLVDSRREIIEKYYYAMYDMVVRGSCHCFGHASRCIPAEGMENRRQMVFGKCECTHNTEGNNCERCRPFYNALNWRPSNPSDIFECKRCNCNGHASSCHYDDEVFKLTGSTGEVCDDCYHNTEGRNCEMCKPFYYQDPNRDIRDPQICQPCGCDTSGSIRDGECQGHADPVRGVPSGKCFCKRNVIGEYCDTCKDGFFELEASNPDGCQACACDILGTVGNRGCDKGTGNCVCKRFVTGRDCDRCYDGFYGLSESQDGCEPCDCDPGGAYNNSCDQATGQCACRPNIEGRQCKQVESGYFYIYQDYFTYEAELARQVGDLDLTEIELRARPEGAYIGWTGPGFMRVNEYGSIEFDIKDLPSSGFYDLVIRYEPQRPEQWDDVRVTITRPGAISRDSACADTIPQDDIMTVSLPSNRRTINVSAVCLEEGLTYTIRVDVELYNNRQVTPSAQILLDSIALLPQAHSNPLFEGDDNAARYRLQQWEHYRCGESFLSAVKPPLSTVCEELLFSMSAIQFNGAVGPVDIIDSEMESSVFPDIEIETNTINACGCNPTGSRSGVCDDFGGKCECKPNVIGRKCDMCAPGTYGFGPNGCIPCECDQQGSVSEFCSPTNGNCVCHDNVYGRQCNECQRGYYNFPNCRECECNGNAIECEQRTGVCIDCQYNTAGDYCDSCEDGFYGDPLRRIPCQPCLCPGGDGSSHQFADTCRLDSRTQTVICDCYDGYTGISCNICDNNYYGNPDQEYGECNQCNCNGNTDLSAPGNCDAGNGKCKQCLYNTDGDSCEMCAAHYYGDALQGTCRECNCFILGTDRRICDLENNCGVCDHETGRCPCLPNVVGQRCERCAQDHWKIASGQGCESCDCCDYGSSSTQCDVNNGQCTCLEGFGGRDCCGCVENFYGDPRVSCTACECDPEGSETLQCRQDGTCVCKEGVTGAKCNECARGYYGDVPACESCGECFHNWDEIIAQLKNETDELLAAARDVKTTGIPKAYEEEFERLQRKLEQAENMTRDPSVEEGDLEDFRLDLANAKKTLKRFGKKSKDLNIQYDNLEEGDVRANRELDALEDDCRNLEEEADLLKNRLVEIESTNIEGAFNSILKSQNQSRQAEAMANDTDAIIAESAEIRAQVEAILAERMAEIEAQKEGYNDRIDMLENQLTGLEGMLADLNEKVCGEPGDECGSCGGAGCGDCGGLGCQGSLTLAEGANDRAQQADNLFEQKLNQSINVLEELEGVQNETAKALKAAQAAYNAALMAKTEAEGAQTNLTGLIADIMGFLLRERAMEDDIKNVSMMALDTHISRTPEEIENLTRQINETVGQLKNIDQILNETRDDLALVNELKKRADAAREFAEEVKASAEGVVDALNQAEAAQEEADDAIKSANKNTNRAEDEIVQIQSEANAAESKADNLQAIIDAMKVQLGSVQGQFVNNEEHIKAAVDAAAKAANVTDEVDANVSELVAKFNTTAVEINMKSDEAAQARKMAEDLLEDATEFKERAQVQYEELKGMETIFTKNQQTIVDLTDEIARLTAHTNEMLADIQGKAQYYRDCNK